MAGQRACPWLQLAAAIIATVVCPGAARAKCFCLLLSLGCRSGMGAGPLHAAHPLQHDPGQGLSSWGAQPDSALCPAEARAQGWVPAAARGEKSGRVFFPSYLLTTVRLTGSIFQARE